MNVLRSGGVRARLAAALLFLFGALIAVVLLPLLAGLVLISLVLVGVAKLRGLAARAVTGWGGTDDAEGRRNVRVKAHDE